MSTPAFLSAITLLYSPTELNTLGEETSAITAVLSTKANPVAIFPALDEFGDSPRI